MNYKVVYFTRTGNSKRIAERIAGKLSVDIIKIVDDMNWRGFFGFLKGGYYASKEKHVDIDTDMPIGEYDEIIVVSPLWAGKIAPSVKSFLENIPPEKINMVITSDSSTVKAILPYKSVSSIMKGKRNEAEVVEKLVKSLKSQTSDRANSIYR